MRWVTPLLILIGVIGALWAIERAGGSRTAWAAADVLAGFGLAGLMAGRGRR